MITMIAALGLACGAFSAAHFAAGWGIGWSIGTGLLAFVVFQFVFGYFMKKRLTADMARVQDILVEGQRRLQAKMQRWLDGAPIVLMSVPHVLA